MQKFVSALEFTLCSQPSNEPPKGQWNGSLVWAMHSLQDEEQSHQGVRVKTAMFTLQGYPLPPQPCHMEGEAQLDPR